MALWCAWNSFSMNLVHELIAALIQKGKYWKYPFEKGKTNILLSRHGVSLTPYPKSVVACHHCVLDVERWCRQWPSFSFIHKTEIMLCFIASKIDELKYAWGTYWWEAFIMLRTTTAVKSTKVIAEKHHKSLQTIQSLSRTLLSWNKSHADSWEIWNSRPREILPPNWKVWPAPNLSFLWRKCLFSMPQQILVNEMTHSIVNLHA